MEQVYLIGSDDVSRAGSSMRSAAEEMQQAARNIDGALSQHQLFLNDWLERFATVLREARTPDEAAELALPDCDTGPIPASGPNCHFDRRAKMVLDALPENETWLTRTAVAGYLGVSIAWMEKAGRTGHGPPYETLSSNSLRYSVALLRRYLLGRCAHHAVRKNVR